MAIRVIGQVSFLRLTVTDNTTGAQVAPTAITATVRPPGGAATVPLAVTPSTDTAGNPIFLTQYKGAVIGTHYLRVETSGPDGAAESVIEIAASQVL